MHIHQRKNIVKLSRIQIRPLPEWVYRLIEEPICSEIAKELIEPFNQYINDSMHLEELLSADRDYEEFSLTTQSVEDYILYLRSPTVFRRQIGNKRFLEKWNNYIDDLEETHQRIKAAPHFPDKFGSIEWTNNWEKKLVLHIKDNWLIRNESPIENLPYCIAIFLFDEEIEFDFLFVAYCVDTIFNMMNDAISIDFKEIAKHYCILQDLIIKEEDWLPFIELEGDREPIIWDKIRISTLEIIEKYLESFDEKDQYSFL